MLNGPHHLHPLGISVQELRQEGKAWPCSTFAGNRCTGQIKISTTVRISMDDREGTMSLDVGITNQF